MNIHRFLWLFVGLLCLPDSVFTQAAEEESQYENYFPLQKGNYWIYRGKTRWTVINSRPTEVREAVLTWRMEVMETLERNHIFAAKMKGHPSDLSWYQAGKKPSEYVIARVGTGHYYQFNDTRVWETLKNPGFLPPETFDHAKLILDVPLIPGKMFGGEITRNDTDYGWFVEGSQPFIDNIKGVSSPRNGAEYTLAFRTRPDHEVIHFVPGLGIIALEYIHHGTTSETELSLVEARLQSSPIAQTPPLLRKLH